jgi:hypothetical protein
VLARPATSAPRARTRHPGALRTPDLPQGEARRLPCGQLEGVAPVDDESIGARGRDCGRIGGAKLVPFGGKHQRVRAAGAHHGDARPGAARSVRGRAVAGRAEAFIDAALIAIRRAASRMPFGFTRNTRPLADGNFCHAHLMRARARTPTRQAACVMQAHRPIAPPVLGTPIAPHTRTEPPTRCDNDNCGSH